MTPVRCCECLCVYTHTHLMKQHIPGVQRTASSFPPECRSNGKIYELRRDQSVCFVPNRNWMERLTSVHLPEGVAYPLDSYLWKNRTVTGPPCSVPDFGYCVMKGSPRRPPPPRRQADPDWGGVPSGAEPGGCSVPHSLDPPDSCVLLMEEGQRGFASFSSLRPTEFKDWGSDQLQEGAPTVRGFLSR